MYRVEKIAVIKRITRIANYGKSILFNDVIVQDMFIEHVLWRFIYPIAVANNTKC